MTSQNSLDLFLKIETFQIMQSVKYFKLSPDLVTLTDRESANVNTPEPCFLRVTNLPSKAHSAQLNHV